jgi:hypothetical protein
MFSAHRQLFVFTLRRFHRHGPEHAVAMADPVELSLPHGGAGAVIPEGHYQHSAHSTSEAGAYYNDHST